MTASIFHNNGKNRLLADRRRLVPNLGPVYCRLLERHVEGVALRSGHVLDSPTGQDTACDHSELDIVLCATRSEKQYTEKILDRLGARYTVLGRQLDRWRHIDKIYLVLDHIDRHPTPELLLHVDATDVLVLGGLDRVVETFRNSFSCGILFGAEKGSAPGSATAPGITRDERVFLERIEQFETSTYPAPFRHLNAGCFVGRKAVIAELFRKALATRPSWPICSVLPNGNVLAEDDQLILRELHRTSHPEIEIDHECSIFQNLFWIRREELAVPLQRTRTSDFISALCGHLGELATGRLRRALGAARWGGVS